jgi:hypothetical protein
VEELAKEAAIINALGKLRDGPPAPRQSGDMRFWVYLHDAKFGSSVSITVTPTLTSGGLCSQFIREGKLKGKAPDYSVFEVSHAVPQYCSIFDRSSFIIKYKNKWIT